uniref:Uncharacterized protein n=1 Tax=Peronospora matthiolae TaxID=2874970 RepID=A0AAV1V589_9STRA
MPTTTGSNVVPAPAPISRAAGTWLVHQHWAADAPPSLLQCRGGGAGSASPIFQIFGGVQAGHAPSKVDGASMDSARSSPPPPKGFAALFRDGSNPKKKDNPASPGLFDIAKPSSRDLMAMIQLYDDGDDRDVILRKLRALSPGVAEVFPYSVELDMGTLFLKVGTFKLIASFLSDHGNVKVEELLSSGQLNVLERSSNGAISIGAKSLVVKRALAGEKFATLAIRFALKATSVLDTCHYVDAFGVSGSMKPELFFDLLHSLGALPLHCARLGLVKVLRFREGQVRIYLRSGSRSLCPEVDGVEVGQFILCGSVHPVRHRDTPSIRPQAPYHRRSRCSLDLTPLASKAAPYNNRSVGNFLCTVIGCGSSGGSGDESMADFGRWSQDIPLLKSRLGPVGALSLGTVLYTSSVANSAESSFAAPA